MKIDLGKDAAFIAELDQFLESTKVDANTIKNTFEIIRDFVTLIESEIESEDKVARASALMTAYSLFRHSRSFIRENTHNIKFLQFLSVKKKHMG